MASGYSDLSEICKTSRAFGVHQKPPKINLLNEKPRRESLIDEQLAQTIVRPLVDYNQQQQVGVTQQQVYKQGSHIITSNEPYSSLGNYITTRGASTNNSRPENAFHTFSPSNITSSSSTSTNYGYNDGGQMIKRTIVTTQTNKSQSQQQQDYTDLLNDLSQKEEKLKQEIAYLNQHMSPWSRPRQIREPRREPPPKIKRNEPKWIKECPSGGTSPRPNSRASSSRSTTEADLMEKASKLLLDVEEIEKKPLKTQQILIESGASKPRSPETTPLEDVGSVHTAIIKVPREEINNKSPLPFSYDNFSTLGVRGNIASVGGAEPDSPYPPIFPVIKRTPSQSNKRF